MEISPLTAFSRDDMFFGSVEMTGFFWFDRDDRLPCSVIQTQRTITQAQPTVILSAAEGSPAVGRQTALNRQTALEKI